MALEIIMLNEISQTQTLKCHLFPLIYITIGYKRLESRRGTIWEEERDKKEERGKTRGSNGEGGYDQNTLYTCIKISNATYYFVQ
jgi:hypothetical protein